MGTPIASTYSRGVSWTPNLADLRQRDVNQLVALAALLRTRSVSEAARQLDVSQPALSRVLERLRGEFDDALLVREANRMRLTPAAEELLPVLEEAIAALEKVYSPRTFTPASARGRFRIGANDYVQHVIGSRLLQEVAEEAPALVLEFRPVGMLQPEHVLGERLVDLMVGATIAHLNLRSQLLYRDPMVCVAAAGTRDAGPMDVAAFSSRSHLDVSPSGMGLLRGLLDRAVSNLGGQRRIAASVSHFMGVPSLLRGTPNLAVVPQRAAQAYGDSVVQVPLTFALPAYEVSMWWHNVTHSDPQARWMRSCVQRIAGAVV